jgi:hypothetical protein
MVHDEAAEQFPLGHGSSAPRPMGRSSHPATRFYTLLVLSRDDLERYAREHPPFGVALMQAVIGLISDRTRATTLRLIARRYDEEVTAIRQLVHDSEARVRVAEMADGLAARLAPFVEGAFAHPHETSGSAKHYSGRPRTQGGVTARRPPPAMQPRKAPSVRSTRATKERDAVGQDEFLQHNRIEIDLVQPVTAQVHAIEVGPTSRRVVELGSGARRHFQRTVGHLHRAVSATSMMADHAHPCRDHQFSAGTSVCRCCTSIPGGTGSSPGGAAASDDDEHALLRTAAATGLYCIFEPDQSNEA